MHNRIDEYDSTIAVGVSCLCIRGRLPLRRTGKGLPLFLRQMRKKALDVTELLPVSGGEELEKAITNIFK